MLKLIYRLVFTIGCAIALVVWHPTSAWAQTNPAELAKAVQEIEHLDSLRSGLASTLEGQTEEPTLQTMQEVCKPVGMKAMQLGQENGWQVKQIANKYRNPAHAPDNPNAEAALAQFEQHPDLVGFWERETINGQAGTRYFRRINVEASCLACHGSENSRPQFVKDNYPQDLAYDFQVGDLRGMYSVFMPDVQASVQQALRVALDPS
ncbi:MAG: Tll0287-like domain-containing protein [Thainema sp.]